MILGCSVGVVGHVTGTAEDGVFLRFMAGSSSLLDGSALRRVGACLRGALADCSAALDEGFRLRGEIRTGGRWSSITECLSASDKGSIAMLEVS